MALAVANKVKVGSFIFKGISCFLVGPSPLYKTTTPQNFSVENATKMALKRAGQIPVSHTKPGLPVVDLALSLCSRCQKKNRVKIKESFQLFPLDRKAVHAEYERECIKKNMYRGIRGLVGLHHLY